MDSTPHSDNGNGMTPKKLPFEEWKAQQIKAGKWLSDEEFKAQKAKKPTSPYNKPYSNGSSQPSKPYSR